MYPSTSFESKVGSSLYSSNREKTFIDKILAEDEIREMQDIMKKVNPSKEDLGNLMNILVGKEMKLLNFDRYDQYIHGKYFIQLRNVQRFTEQAFDAAEDLEKVIHEDDKKMLYQAKRKMIENLKFACDIFHYATRTTLSFKATAFDTIMTQKFEYQYNPAMQGGLMPTEQAKKKFLGVI